MSDDTIQPITTSKVLPTGISESEDYHQLDAMCLMIMLLSDAISIKGQTLISMTKAMNTNASSMLFWENWVQKLPIPYLPDGPQSAEAVERAQEKFKAHQEIVTIGENNVSSGRQEGDTLSASAQAMLDQTGQQCSELSSMMEKQNSIIRSIKDMNTRR